jgi:hypothetical protein
MDEAAARQGGDAGVDLVVAHLEDDLAGQGLDVLKMPDNNKRYDVLVKDKRTGAAVRYIAVKSTEERWGLRGAGLSQPQFQLASMRAIASRCASWSTCMSRRHGSGGSMIPPGESRPSSTTRAGCKPQLGTRGSQARGKASGPPRTSQPDR